MDTKKNQGRLAGLYFILFIFLLIGQTLLFARDNKPLGFFPLRSQSPIQQLRFGIQHHPPWTVPRRTWALQLQHTWKNMWLYDEQRFLIDGEIHETVLRNAYGITDRFEVMLELPVRHLSGGVLDGLIEGFHQMMGLGQAGRDKFPRNRFAVEITTPDKNGSKVQIRSSDAGWQVGNIVLSFTYSLVKDQNHKFRAIVSSNMKLPTATTTEMFGSQKMDFGLSLGTGYNMQPFHLYYNAGLIYFGDRTILGIELRQWHISSLLALEYHPTGGRHSWVLQGLVENGVAQDYGQFSKRTSEILFGYKRFYDSGWVLEVGFLENLFYFDNSPDIALHLAVTKFLSFPNRLSR